MVTRLHDDLHAARVKYRTMQFDGWVAATPTLMCDDSCELAADGVCQDGGENDDEVHQWPEPSCQIGTDCTDCGSTPSSESGMP